MTPTFKKQNKTKTENFCRSPVTKGCYGGRRRPAMAGERQKIKTNEGNDRRMNLFLHHNSERRIERRHKNGPKVSDKKVKRQTKNIKNANVQTENLTSGARNRNGKCPKRMRP